jgi:hypothetical protein
LRWPPASFFGLAVTSVVAGLPSVLLLGVLRLLAPLPPMPLSGLGFIGMRRRRFGPAWGELYDGQEWENGVPPRVSEWRRRLHNTPLFSNVMISRGRAKVERLHPPNL